MLNDTNHHVLHPKCIAAGWHPDLPVPVPVNGIQLRIFVGNTVIISEPVKLLAFRVENVNAYVRDNNKVSIWIILNAVDLGRSRACVFVIIDKALSVIAI